LLPSIALMTWLNWTGQPNKLLEIKDPVGISRRISEPWTVLMGTADPEAERIMQQYLAQLKTQGLPIEQQGVWLQSGLFLLAEHKGQTPLPAASLTKIATTLAALLGTPSPIRHPRQHQWQRPKRRASR
jgi:hypothetical protein